MLKPPARDAMLHFSWRHAYILYFMFDPNTDENVKLLSN